MHIWVIEGLDQGFWTLQGAEPTREEAREARKSMKILLPSQTRIVKYSPSKLEPNEINKIDVKRRKLRKQSEEDQWFKERPGGKWPVPIIGKGG